MGARVRLPSRSFTAGVSGVPAHRGVNGNGPVGLAPEEIALLDRPVEWGETDGEWRERPRRSSAAPRERVENRPSHEGGAGFAHRERSVGTMSFAANRYGACALSLRTTPALFRNSSLHRLPMVIVMGFSHAVMVRTHQ